MFLSRREIVIIETQQKEQNKRLYQTLLVINPCTKHGSHVKNINKCVNYDKLIRSGTIIKIAKGKGVDAFPSSLLIFTTLMC
jgi:hypothetical protein